MKQSGTGKIRYKYEKGDEVGIYRVIKTLPNKPHVKNLRIYCECLLCGEKVERWSNRLDSKHRGCAARDVVVDKPELLPVPKSEPKAIKPKPHTKKDGKVVRVDRQGRIVAEPKETADSKTLLEQMDLPDDVRRLLNIDYSQEVSEMVRKAENLDQGQRFLFITTLKRYLTLLELSHDLEVKIANLGGQLITTNSNGNQVAHPVIVQYKQLSSESNAVAKVLNSILTKNAGSDDDDDPLAKLLGGGE